MCNVSNACLIDIGISLLYLYATCHMIFEINLVQWQAAFFNIDYEHTVKLQALRRQININEGV